MPDVIAGRYEVLREIGRGGMGAVWLCRDNVLGREVAVKQLGGLPGESSPHVARALREARSSAALNHPHVVSIFDAVEEGDHVWLVMEYVPGSTLAALTRDAGPLDPRRAAYLCAQVADGLAAAHARGTIHRDVKPGNVLVGEGDLAKISDFGIARQIDDETLTQTGMVTGTPLFFSPQLARGASAAPADDVWALGATLFSAVEGAPPWPQQENPIAMLVHIAENPPAAPQRAGPLAPVISSMMATDPAQRLAMDEVARQLHAVADGRPGAGAESGTRVMPVVPAEAAPEPEPPQEPTHERIPAPRPAAAAAAAGAAERDDRSRRWAPVLLVAAALVLVVALAAAFAAGAFDGDDTEPTASDPTDTNGGTRAANTPPQETESTSATEDTEPPASTETEDTQPVGSTDAGQFVADYYGLLPDNTQEAWALLSEEMQADVGSYSSYQGFWNTIDAVSVDSTSDEGGGTVAVDITYTTDGSTQSETRLITVEETEAGPLIVADEVA